MHERVSAQVGAPAKSTRSGAATSSYLGGTGLPTMADQGGVSLQVQSHSVTEFPIFGQLPMAASGRIQIQMPASMRTGLSQGSAAEGEWDARGTTPKRLRTECSR